MRFPIKIVLGFCIVLSSCYGVSINNQTSSGYLIRPDSASEADICENLCNTVNKRADGNPFFLEKKKTNDLTKKITVRINSSSNSMAELVVAEDEYIITGNSEKNVKWLFWQVINGISKVDERIDKGGLPPEIISALESTKVNFQFNYREPFFEPNQNENYREMHGTHSLETEWGIWGHNLGKVVPDMHNTECLSLVDNTRNESQFCFSSEATFNNISNFILNDFGDNINHSKKFMIAPNDNAIVCLCQTCTDHGNTKKNAAPALLFLLNRLATKYRYHDFFTLDYLSVNSPTGDKLAENTGVLISTIQLKRNTDFLKNKNTLDFEKNVTKWNQIVNSVYTWDYGANFDDYLSPYPNLSLFQDYLNYFDSIGISGIFCNGSGYEYSVFDDIKTYVMSALLIDSKTSIEQHVKSFTRKEYPVSGELISGYFLKLEAAVKTNKTELNIYGGITELKNNFLNSRDLLDFTDSLQLIKNRANIKERAAIEKLITSLSFSKLQILLAEGLTNSGFATVQDNKVLLSPHFLKYHELLSSNYETTNISVFKEKGGDLKNYLDQLNRLIIDNKKINNTLYQKYLTPMTELDEDYTDTRVLTDGIRGLESDYHTNWFLNSFGECKLVADNLDENKKYSVEISFINNPNLKLIQPDSVLILDKNQEVCILRPTNKSKNRTVFLGEFDSQNSTSFTIVIVSNKVSKKFACDEISFY